MPIYDLEMRTFRFAQQVRALVRKIPCTLAGREDGKQLIRSSGSVGANFIEANQAVSQKDRAYRIRLCRKEAKESLYWLKLIETSSQEQEEIKQALLKESGELVKIFGAIVSKHRSCQTDHS